MKTIGLFKVGGRVCCSGLHRLELLRQVQAKDGNSGH